MKKRNASPKMTGVSRVLSWVLSAVLLCSGMVFAPTTAQAAASGVTTHYKFSASTKLATNEAALSNNIIVGANVTSLGRIKFVFTDGQLALPGGVRNVVTYNISTSASTRSGGSVTDPADHLGLPYRVYQYDGSTSSEYVEGEDQESEDIKESEKAINENIKLYVDAMDDLDTSGLAAANVSVLYGFFTGSNANNVAEDRTMEVYVTLDDGERTEVKDANGNTIGFEDNRTWLGPVGVRSTTLLGGYSLSTSEGFPGLFYQIETENLLDIPGVKGNTIKNIMVMPHGESLRAFGRVAIGELSVNTFDTEADFDYYVPADDITYTDVGEETLRAITVEEAVRTATIEWTTDKDVKTWFGSKPSYCRYYSKVSGSNWVDSYYGLRPITVTHRGPTYERYVDSTRELFQTQVPNGKYIGPAEMTNKLDDPNSVFGMDCQTYVFNAISRVSRSYAWACMNTINATYTSIVGDHLVVRDHPWFMDTDVKNLNSEQAMYWAYAQAQAGDVVDYYTFKGSHTRIVKSAEVTYVDAGEGNGALNKVGDTYVWAGDGKGRYNIDPAASYLYCAEQASIPKYFFQHETTGEIVSAYYTTGIGGEPYTTYSKDRNYTLLYSCSSRDNTKASFTGLYSAAYVPFTLDEYKTGKVEDPRMQVTLGSKQNGQSFMDGGGASIAISTNYRVIKYRVELQSMETGATLFDSGTKYVMDSLTNAILLGSSTLDTTLRGLSEGVYTLTVTADCGPFTKLGQDTVPQLVETIDFYVPGSLGDPVTPVDGDVFYIPGMMFKVGETVKAYVIDSDHLEVGSAVLLTIPEGAEVKSSYKSETIARFWEMKSGVLKRVYGYWYSSSKYKFGYHDRIYSLSDTTMQVRHASGHTGYGSNCTYAFGDSCAYSSYSTRYYESPGIQTINGDTKILDLRTDVISGKADPVTTLAQVKKLTDQGNAIINTYVPDGASKDGTYDNHYKSNITGTTAMVVVIDPTIDVAFEGNYEVSVGSVAGGTLSLDRTSGAAGDLITVSVTPNDGFELVNILVDGKAIDGNSFTIRGNHTVTAQFMTESYALKTGDVFFLLDNLKSGTVNKAYILNSDTLPANTVVKFIPPNGDGSKYHANHFAFVNTSGNVTNVYGGTYSGSAVLNKYAYHEVITAVDEAAGTITLGNPANGEHISKATCPWCSGYTGASGAYKGEGYFYESCESSKNNECIAVQKYDADTVIIDLRAAVTAGTAAPVTTVAQVKALCDAENAIVNVFAPDATASASGTLSAIIVMDPAPNFTPNGMVSVGAVKNGTVSVSRSYGAAGTQVTVTATPAQHYELESILVDGKIIEGNTFAISGDHEVTANFVPKQYAITLGACENGSVSLSAEQAPYGSQVTVIAEPAEHYELDTVYVDGVAIEGNTFTVTGEHTVTATFKAKVYTISVASSSNGTVVLNKTSGYYGDEIIISSGPSSKYYVVTGATVDGVEIEPDENGILKFTITGDHTVAGIFGSYVLQPGDVFYPLENLYKNGAKKVVIAKSATVASGLVVQTTIPNQSAMNGSNYLSFRMAYVNANGNITLYHAAIAKHMGTMQYKLAAHEALVAVDTENKTFTMGDFADGLHGSAATCLWNNGGTPAYKSKGYHMSSYGACGCETQTGDECAAVQYYDENTAFVDLRAVRTGTNFADIKKLTVEEFAALAGDQTVMLDVYVPDADATFSGTASLVIIMPISPNATYYNVKVGEVTNGTVTTSAASGLEGAEITVTATPVYGCELEAIYVDGVAIEGNTFVVTGDHTVTATFKGEPAHVHTEEKIPGKAATCTEPGLTEGKKCSVCGETITAQTEIPALDHTEETVSGKAATCTEAGLTDGAKCSVCGETITAQTEIPMLGHDIVQHAAQAPTTENVGWEAYETCTRCDYTTYVELPKLEVTTYAITVGAVSNGTVAVDKAEAEAGETVTVTAAPASGYACTAILVDGVKIEGNTFVVTGNHTVTATFAKKTAFAGSTVSMTEVIDVNFMFNKAALNGQTGCYVEFVGPGSKVGETKTVRVEQADWGSYNSSLYKVTYQGLAAKQMGQDIIATVYNADGVALSDPYTESVRAYAGRALKSSNDAKLKTLIVDMLNYGAAAQTQFKYATDDLANNQLTAEQAALGTATTKAYTDNSVKTLNNVGSTFGLESRIELNMYFKKMTVTENTYALVKLTHHNATTETVVRIEGSEFNNSGSYTIVPIAEMVAADGRVLVTCEVYNGDTLVAAGTDSLESYVARAMKSNSTTNKWLEEVLDFTDSAYNYLH